MNVLRTLAKNWFQFAVYNGIWVVTTIAIVCRESLNIELVELEGDMVEIACEIGLWHSQITGVKPMHNTAKESILVK